MLIGLLSDTHDRIDAARAAVKMLRDNGAEYLLHAGDVCGEAVIDTLTGGPAGLVWGNNDGDRRSLAAYCKTIGVTCFDVLGEIEIEGKQIAITHGDDAGLLKQILRDQQHDYLITGHTHVAHDRWSGKCRWINPGALHRAAVKSVAILDTTADTLRTLRI